jgi:hypothetical protein
MAALMKRKFMLVAVAIIVVALIWILVWQRYRIYCTNTCFVSSPLSYNTRHSRAAGPVFVTDGVRTVLVFIERPSNILFYWDTSMTAPLASDLTLKPLKEVDNWVVDLVSLGNGYVLLSSQHGSYLIHVFDDQVVLQSKKLINVDAIFDESQSSLILHDEQGQVVASKPFLGDDWVFPETSQELSSKTFPQRDDDSGKKKYHLSNTLADGTQVINEYPDASAMAYSQRTSTMLFSPNRKTQVFAYFGNRASRPHIAIDGERYEHPVEIVLSSDRLGCIATNWKHLLLATGGGNHLRSDGVTGFWRITLGPKTLERLQRNHAVEIWDMRTGERIARFRHNFGRVLGVAVSDNGEWVAASAQNGVMLWRINP